MTKYIKINKEFNIKCNKQIKEYLNPDYIYLPYDEKGTLNIKGNEIIYKNSIIQVNNNKFTYSPISGKVIGLCDNIIDGKKCKTIVIENDFKENVKKITGTKNNISDISVDELNKIINGLGAYNGQLSGKTMIINGIDLEPYEETYSYLIHEYTEQILDTIDALFNILNVRKCFFAINNNSANVETLINQIGTYPNIELKLLPDIYPIGHRDILIKELVWTSRLDKGIIYLTAEDVYNIYNVLKKKKPITEKLVTITGNLLNKSKVVKVKIGTRIADIINDEFKILSDDYHIVINGLLSGYEVKSLNTIITPNIRSVFIESIDNSLQNNCINCGLCHINCPVKADPRSGYNMKKCLKCGLCNYICPSKIKLVGDKNE